MRVQPYLNILYFRGNEPVSPSAFTCGCLTVEALNVNGKVTTLTKLSLSCFRCYTSQRAATPASSADSLLTTPVVVLPCFSHVSPCPHVASRAGESPPINTSKLARVQLSWCQISSNEQTGTSLGVLRAKKSLLPAFKSPSFPLHRAAILLLHMVRWQAGQRHVVTAWNPAENTDPGSARHRQSH